MTPLTDLFGRAIKLFRRSQKPKYAKIEWEYNDAMFENLSNYIMKLKEDLENEKSCHRMTRKRYVSFIEMEKKEMMDMMNKTQEAEEKAEKLEMELAAMRMKIRSLKRPKCGKCRMPYETEPRVLACGHSICISCAGRLIHMAPNAEQVIQCCQDGLISFLDGEGINMLPLNKDLMRYVQNIAHLRYRH